MEATAQQRHRHIYECQRCPYFTHNRSEATEHYRSTHHPFNVVDAGAPLAAGRDADPLIAEMRAVVEGLGLLEEPPPESVPDKLQTALALAQNLRRVLSELLQEPAVKQLGPRACDELGIIEFNAALRAVDLQRLVQSAELVFRGEVPHA